MPVYLRLKRCETPFGPVFIVAGPIQCVFHISNLYIHKRFVSIKKTWREKINHVPKAQTTHLASFGPVFIVAGPIQCIFHISNLYIHKRFVSIKKTWREKKITYLRPKRCIWHRLGLFLLLLAQSNAYFIFQTYTFVKDSLLSLVLKKHEEKKKSPSTQSPNDASGVVCQWASFGCRRPNLMRPFWLSPPTLSLEPSKCS
jgi:hypothetical protein